MLDNEQQDRNNLVQRLYIVFMWKKHENESHSKTYINGYFKVVQSNEGARSPTPVKNIL